MHLPGLVLRSRLLTLAVGLLLVFVVGFLDLVTGQEISFSLFYLFPIGLSAWLAGRQAGIAVAVASALAWLAADLRYADYSHALIPLWNTLVRLNFFIISILLLSTLQGRRRLELERALAERTAQEQRRIGQELHDTVMQQLVGTKMLADQLRRTVNDSDTTSTLLTSEISGGLAEAAGQLRRLMSGLVPAPVDPSDILPALDRVVQNFRAWCDLPVSLTSSSSVALRDERTARHLILLVQEALMNAAKHARASQVQVSLEATDHALILRVSDDGVGLPDRSSKRGGLGLQSMQDRAEVLGASLELGRGPQGGTVITCTLPGHTSVEMRRQEPPDHPLTRTAVNGRKRNA